MPEAKINVLREAPDLKQLAEEVARLQKLLRWLLNGQIDFENIRARSIKGENIEAETITTTELAADSVTADKIAAGSVTTDKLDAGAVTADKIDAGAVTTSKLAAGAVTADKIDVNELSAITADLGHITAGLIEAVQIFGSYIATANGTYPRAELSVNDDMFRVMQGPGEYAGLIADDQFGVPAYVIYESGIMRFYMNFLSPEGVALASTGDMSIIGGNDLYLSTFFGLVKLSNWSNLYSTGAGQTLQQALDAKQNAIAGASGTFTSQDGKTITVINGIVTSIV